MKNFENIVLTILLLRIVINYESNRYKKQIVNGSLTPIGDISDYEDVANAVWFFATDMSKNTTGNELIVDGGMSCQLYPEILNELKRKLIENM